MRLAQPWMHSSGCWHFIPVKSAANINGSSHGLKRCRQPPERSRMSRPMIALTHRQWQWFFVTVLILGSLFIVATRVRPQQTTAAPAAVTDVVLRPAPLADHPAPDFTLTNLDGTNITLSDLKGQVLLINVWATWCPPCRVEMPTIQAAYLQYHDQGFTVRSEEHTSELQSRPHLVCRLLLEKKKK